jgi:phosphoribosylanthranilate isomerase
LSDAAGGTAVKICGVCSAADAALATSAGAAYIGVILAPGYSRSQSLADGAEILQTTTAQRVGVFVNPARGEVIDAVARLGLDVVQLHGDEPPAEISALRPALAAHGAPRIWKAVRVRKPADIAAAATAYAGVADGLLLDGWSAHAHGGTGTSFDWAAAAKVRAALPAGLTLIVAGGLGAANVREVVAHLQPDVVDVSSGVEGSPCRKSAEKVRAFIAAAHDAAEG